MITFFTNEKGNVLFTYSDIAVQTGDFVKHDDKTYSVVFRMLNIEGGFFTAMIHEVNDGMDPIDLIKKVFKGMEKMDTKH